MAWRGASTVGLLIMGFLLLSAAVEVRAQVTCGTVGSKIAPCLSFVTGRGGAKPLYQSPCCNGIRGLDALASKSTPNRRSICTCLKNAARILNPNPAAVSGLGSSCGARNAFNLNENCNTIP